MCLGKATFSFSIVDTSADGKQEKIKELELFAKPYVDDIIEKATVIASKKDPTLQSINSVASQNQYKATTVPTSATTDATGSWIARMRHLLRSLLMSLCLCKSSTCKQNSTHSFAEV